ncbi:MAG: hypothetical protein NTU58_01485 [Candidatus Nealsonbacteria bacterium]|nr:hypothetical protein [Candidatus Nealsonbacteria bacterium]
MGKFNFKNEDDFQKIKSEAEEFYGTINDIYCPYLKEKIAFNVKGLKHLKFISDRQARPRKDQYSRLKLIRFAPEVLKLSHTLQGIWRIKRFESQKTNSRWEQVLKDVIYYEFIAVIENIRIKVIIKEVLGGEKHFWSIIPFWGIDKMTSKRILHGGDPEID